MSNRLADQTSLYLRQHAQNPVHWQPWDATALAEARARKQPILLSIGYSACHWCHVMAHESFEDAATAAVLNHHFVNIKVDREERPDLDKIYQLAHQLLLRRPGGWPLTLLLDPQTLLPFFAGTYFPKTPAHGLPAFASLCERLAQIWREDHDALLLQMSSLQEALHALACPASDSRLPSPLLLDEFEHDWLAGNDPRHGGLAGAPKFPQAPMLALLLERAAEAERAGVQRASLDKAVKAALDAIVQGGLCDHLSGGFFRYCVDEQWQLPHFEKMLYDNALLLALLSDACGQSGSPRYAQAALSCGAWLLHAMQHPNGGFYAALDADSLGQEGAYYLWSREQFTKVLDADENRFACALFGLDGPPNYQEAGHAPRWHLSARPELYACAEALGVHRKHASLLQESARTKLLAARELRSPPACDDKILVSSNGLAITALTRAALRFNRPDFLSAAENAAAFIEQHCWRDGRLAALWCRGEASQRATLDDYAFLAQGLLELVCARWNDREFAWLLAIVAVLRQHFEDPLHGGFYFTADDSEPLPQRPKPLADEAIPAGNGVLARLLIRLGHLLADEALLEAGIAVLRAAGQSMAQHPLAHPTLLLALGDALQAPELIILRGPGYQLASWSEAGRAGYHPERLILALPNDAALPETLMQRYPPVNDATAYICRGVSCQAPITELRAYTEWLDRDAAGRAWQ